MPPLSRAALTLTRSLSALADEDYPENELAADAEVPYDPGVYEPEQQPGEQEEGFDHLARFATIQNYPSTPTRVREAAAAGRSQRETLVASQLAAQLHQTARASGQQTAAQCVPAANTTRAPISHGGGGRGSSDVRGSIGRGDDRGGRSDRPSATDSYHRPQAKWARDSGKLREAMAAARQAPNKR